MLTKGEGLAVDVMDMAAAAGRWIAAHKLATLFVLVVGTELAFRRFAPRSRAYALWTKTFERIGVVWTTVILSVVYFGSVSVVSLGMKLSGRDLLDRRLGGPSAWKPHEPNPLGALAAARHQF